MEESVATQAQTNRWPTGGLPPTWEVYRYKQGWREPQATVDLVVSWDLYSSHGKSNREAQLTSSCPNRKQTERETYRQRKLQAIVNNPSSGSLMETLWVYLSLESLLTDGCLFFLFFLRHLCWKWAKSEWSRDFREGQKEGKGGLQYENNQECSCESEHKK